MQNMHDLERSSEEAIMIHEQAKHEMEGKD